MDGLNKMSTDEYMVIPDYRKKLYDELQGMDHQLCSISLNGKDIITQTLTFGNLLLTGLSCQAYNNGSLDLVTLYKNMIVYNDIVKGLNSEDTDFMDGLIDLFSFDISSYTMEVGKSSTKVDITLCTGEVLTLSIMG